VSVWTRPKLPISQVAPGHKTKIGKRKKADDNKQVKKKELGRDLLK